MSTLTANRSNSNGSSLVRSHKSLLLTYNKLLHQRWIQLIDYLILKSSLCKMIYQYENYTRKMTLNNIRLDRQTAMFCYLKLVHVKSWIKYDNKWITGCLPVRNTSNLCSNTGLFNLSDTHLVCVALKMFPRAAHTTQQLHEKWSAGSYSNVGLMVPPVKICSFNHNKHGIVEFTHPRDSLHSSPASYRCVQVQEHGCQRCWSSCSVRNGGFSFKVREDIVH